jgi:hypothetical protein
MPDRDKRFITLLFPSENAKAVAAINEFLKFQIKKHQTGDALEVKYFA